MRSLTLDTRVILEARPPRNAVDPTLPHACFVEQEFCGDGTIEDVTTIIGINRECPFRCLMCDLWRNTTPRGTPDGIVAGQVKHALQEIPWTPHVKFYNAGNFFDEKAVSPSDRDRIAELVNDRRTLVIENHPRLIDQRCIEYALAISPRLEVAMGLETVDPSVLPRLNKGMTLDDFERACHLLSDHHIGIRAFILLRTPWQTEQEGVHWAKRSIAWAFDAGVECCVIIPTRAGNGIMDQLQESSEFTPPSIDSLEEVHSWGIEQGRGRVFADTWDIDRTGCDTAAIHAMNLHQETPQ
ncbi:MAG: hypothetical protein QGH76_00405 [Phycisphaerales bacterium]|nr:hypothetical protein [Phycisphaerales bacterium]